MNTLPPFMPTSQQLDVEGWRDLRRQLEAAWEAHDVLIRSAIAGGYANDVQDDIEEMESRIRALRMRIDDYERSLSPGF